MWLSCNIKLAAFTFTPLLTFWKRNVRNAAYIFSLLREKLYHRVLSVILCRASKFCHHIFWPLFKNFTWATLETEPLFLHFGWYTSQTIGNWVVFNEAIAFSAQCLASWRCRSQLASISFTYDVAPCNNKFVSSKAKERSVRKAELYSIFQLQHFMPVTSVSCPISIFCTECSIPPALCFNL